MAETQDLSSRLLEESDQEVFIPSDIEKTLVGKVFRQFTSVAQERNNNFEYLDGRTIINYINDSVRRFITTTDERDDIEDWQARVFDPFTRNKLIAILSKVSALIPFPEFRARGQEDLQREQILSDLYQYSDEVDDTEELMFYALLEGLVKGTVVGYEGYEEKEKKVRGVSSWDTGEKLISKEDTVITRKLKGYIVPLEDFYPASIGIRKISDMPFCYWRSFMSFEEFSLRFSHFKKAKFVKGYSLLEITSGAQENSSSVRDEQPFYRDFISSDTPEGSVEVVRYYNQDTDEYVLIANGVWLNPLNGKDEVMPLPFNHKKLPFWKAIYEPFGADFFYGKSLPDKLKPMQDVINVLHNMMLDQSFLSIFPPLLVGGTDDIEDDVLRPGRRIPVDSIDNYKELQISTPSGFHQFILTWTKQVLEESSVDAVNQGVAGTGGDRVTATEIERAAQSVTSILGLFVNFVKWGVQDKATLRAKNILQFYNRELVEGITGEGGTEKFNKAFNTFKLDDTVLSTGKRGTKIIEMFREATERPTRMQLVLDAKVMAKKTGRRVEKVAILSQYLRDFEFDIRIIPNPKRQESKALDRALLLEKAKVYLEFMPELIDKEELAVQIAEAFGDRPEKVLKRELMNPTQERTGQFPGAGDTGVGANMQRGLVGNEDEGMALRNLSNQGA